MCYAVKEHYRDGLIADIGCGRGEWLELLSENGIGNIGIDLDEGMLQRAEEAGLNVRRWTALNTSSSNRMKVC
ncbi:class I SAM-dependent methyltransferase [Mangrovibacter sp. SLW1]